MDDISIRRDRDKQNFVLDAKQWLPHPIDKVFAFFSDACQLETLTPGWLKFAVLTPPPIDMHAGAIIDYKLTLHGFPIRWKTRIEVWEPPHRFVDLQIRGPYRLWLHEHTFTESEGGTLVCDRVTYDVPGGRFVNWLLVRRDVEKIFAFRHDQLNKIFADDSSHADVPQSARNR